MRTKFQRKTLKVGNFDSESDVVISMRIGMLSKFSAPDGLCIRTGAVLKGLANNNNEVHALTQSKFVEDLPEERIHRFRRSN